MRYSYGILDRKKILLYNPQLFLNGDDILIFPSQNFHKWHGDIKEYVDSLYQISAIKMTNEKSMKVDEFDLAIAVLNNINEELKNLFSTVNTSDLSYQYISTMDEKYKKRRKNNYSSDMRRCDIRIPVKKEITPWLKYQNINEIIEEAWELFNSTYNHKNY